MKMRTPCVIVRRSENNDRYGRAVLSEKRITTKCAVIHLYNESEDTTVRADSSSSRGRAEERIASGRLLFSPNEKISIGDLVEITLKGGDKMSLVTVRTMRRPDVKGRIHHIEWEGDIWVSE